MCGVGGGSLQKLETYHERRSGPINTHAPVDLARIIHDGSSRNRQDALRDGHAEARGTKAYLNSTSRSRGTSLPAWPPHTRNQACRSSVLAVAVEVFMNNAG